MTFSTRLKSIRKNLTQKEFAMKIGVSLGAVQHWEIDNIPPNGSALIKLREVFGVDLNWLLTGEGEPTDKTVPPDQPENINVIEIQHMNLVRGFRDKQRALNINKELMELETLDSETFNRIEGYIKGTVDSLRMITQRTVSNSRGEDRKKDTTDKMCDNDHCDAEDIRRVS